MKPNDDNGKLDPEQRPFRVLVIAASDRRQYNCPGVDSKARTLMFKLADALPADWEIDLEDLGNVYKRAPIASCNGCASTSMALCVWPCNCYEKNGPEPDLMWELDLYSRLDLADAWVFVGPVYWYSCPSNLKLLFDRLVCMSGGNPREDLIDHKDPELAMALERSAEWEELSRNHLEGRTAAFFCYGDAGANEIAPGGRPKLLLHPHYFDPEREPFADMRDAYAPLVWQCRYSGIEVPEELWRYQEIGAGKPYSENQAEHLVGDSDVLRGLLAFAEAVVSFVAAKGKVKPGRYRAFGYHPPGHLIEDAKLGWRELRMRLGRAPEGSSPAAQEQLDLNRDVTLRPKLGEGAKLRE
jgi:multimeric flavodoxin WrbA